MRRFLCFKNSTNMINLHFIVASFLHSNILLTVTAISMTWSFYLIHLIMQMIRSYNRQQILYGSRFVSDLKAWTNTNFLKLALSKFRPKTKTTLSENGERFGGPEQNIYNSCICNAERIIQEENFAFVHIWPGSACELSMRNLLNTLEHVHINEQ